MTSNKDFQDILRSNEVYTFQEAVRKFAGERADPKRISTAENMLREAVTKGELKATLIHLPNSYVKQLKDDVFTRAFKSRGYVQGEARRHWITCLLTQKGFYNRRMPIEATHSIIRDMLNSKTVDEGITWEALTIECLEYCKEYNEELFNRESNKIDWDKSKITYAAINEYCINEGIIHPYFNPASEDPKTETINTPESNIPSADDSKDIAIIETDCSKRTRTRKATEIHSENANKRLADTINELEKKTPDAVNEAKKLGRPLIKNDLLKLAKPVLIECGYKATPRSKPFEIWRDLLPDGVADRQNRAQKNRR